MANLNVVDYAVKDGKLVPTSVRKLKDTDFQLASTNVGLILNTLVEPLSKFGRAAKEGSGWFSDGVLEAGLDSAAKVGNIISSIGKGVADMANFNVVDYVVKGNKLIPSGIRKLKDTDFELAATNVDLILKTLIGPLTKFGRAAKEGSGLFSDGVLDAGINAAVKVGNILTGIAKGVADMANLQVITYKVSNGKLVPADVVPLKPDDFKKAASNVNEILKALQVPLTDFGKAWKGGGGWFSKGDLEAGIVGIGKISDPIGKLAKMVVDMAAGRATVSEIKDGKLVPTSTISFAQAVPLATAAIDNLLKALPKTLTTFGAYFEENQDSIEQGIDGISVLAKSFNSIAQIGLGYTENKAKIDAAPGAVNIVSSTMPSMINIAKNYAKMQNVLGDFGNILSQDTSIVPLFKDINKALIEINPQIAGIGAEGLRVLGPASKDMAMIAQNYSFIQNKTGNILGDIIGKKSITPMFKDLNDSLKAISPGLLTLNPQKIKGLSDFTTVIERLTKIVGPFDKFVKSFKIFTKDMGLFVTQWKKFGNTDAQNFKTYGTTIEQISKVNVNTLKQSLDIMLQYEREKISLAKEQLAANQSIAASTAQTAAATTQMAKPSPTPSGGKAAPAPGPGGKATTAPPRQGDMVITGNLIVQGKVK